MSLEIYNPRKISFFDLVKVDDWDIKVYTITNRESFQSIKILENALKNIKAWLQKPKNSELPTYNVAFLIVHEGREGVWLLFNWWTDGEMLETILNFADIDLPEVIGNSPHPGARVCVWELEVILYEREAWIKHILKNAQDPKFKNYLDDSFRQQI